jgi:PAS domain S-box-containing protein
MKSADAASGPTPQDVARQLELLAAVARRTGNAVIVTDSQQRIEWVNDGFVRLTGYSSADVVGRVPRDVLQGPDSDPVARAHMAAAIRSEQPFDAEILNYGKDGHQYWVRIEAEPTRDAAGSVTGYIAVETDITERRITASRERLTRGIGEQLLSCESIEGAARIVVDGLVRTYDIRAASVWTVQPGRPLLRFVAGAVSSPDYTDWLEATSARSFARGTDWVVGVGAPGVAWGTAAPCRKTDFWEQDQHGQYSRRAQAARKAGIRTVCAVPVLGPDGVLAVIEFGGSHAYPGHERLPALLEQVAQQFGAFVAQHQSRRAFEVLFQHSPDALLVVDASGLITAANTRANTLFGPIAGFNLWQQIEDGLGLLTLLAEDAPDVVYERLARRVDGSTFGAELTVSRAVGTGAPQNIVSVRDLTERRRAEEALRRSLAEKVTLVQEVHHRVKNNLQVLSSLISLQASGVEDATVQSMLRDTENRIQSMALVHQQLYGHADLSRIGFDTYAQSLCGALRNSLAPSAELRMHTQPVEIPIERAVPAGLILNELVTNAFKYSSRPDGSCYVRVDVEPLGDGFAFTVSDQGKGLGAPEGRKVSMGTTLINALVRQLRARRTVGEGPGTSIRIEVREDGGR